MKTDDDELALHTIQYTHRDGRTQKKIHNFTSVAYIYKYATSTLQQCHMQHPTHKTAQSIHIPTSQHRELAGLEVSSTFRPLSQT